MKMNIEEAFNKYVSIKKNRSGMYEAKCLKGLFSVSGPSKDKTTREAKHYFRQYFEDGEYD